ncbi:hypothetical protein J6590_016816 [Homalodisca vitripennis]|nr:hypothetical protein J6590_016816 [Homalodisca vitripennis]
MDARERQWGRGTAGDDVQIADTQMRHAHRLLLVSPMTEVKCTFIFHKTAKPHRLAPRRVWAVRYSDTGTFYRYNHSEFAVVVLVQCASDHDRHYHVTGAITISSRVFLLWNR